MSEWKQKPCWFTGEMSEQLQDFSTDNVRVKSEACGDYIMVEDAIMALLDRREENRLPIGQGHLNCARRSLEVRRENRNAIAIWCTRAIADQLRAALLRQQRASHEFEKVVCVLEDYMEEPVDHSEKPMILLESFARRLQKQRAYTKFNVTLEDRAWARIVDKEELFQVLDHLYRTDSHIAIEQPPVSQDRAHSINAVHNTPIQFTVFGWEAIRKRSSYPLTNKVFIATQFEWPGEQQLHQETMNAIKRACKTLGYEADWVAQNHTGNITDRIVADIKKARFVIAELTYHNRGVYFESGLARGLGIPVFHLVRDGFTSGSDAEGKKIHFDVAQVMYRSWVSPADLEQKLTDWIDATLGKYTSR